MSPFSVILVTGGSNSEIGEFSQAVAVEVFSEDGTPLSMCSLPPLPPRFKHTQSGVLACGGYYYSDTTTNCFTLSNEGWYQSHNLREGLVKTRTLNQCRLRKKELEIYRSKQGRHDQ